MNYDAINIGERDFFQKVEFLTEVQDKYQLPFLSANIFQPDGKTLLFKPYMIKEMNAFKHNGKKIQKLRVGIFGLVFKRLQIVIDKKEPQLVVTDPIEAAKKVVAELKDKCNVIIALAHIRYPQVKMLAETVNDIDVIIASHDPIYRPNPEQYGSAIALIGGNRGQYIGDLRLDFDKDKNIVNHIGRVVMLKKDIKNDDKMNRLISEYKSEKNNRARNYRKKKK